MANNKILALLIAATSLLMIGLVGVAVSYDQTTVSTQVNITQSAATVANIVINQGGPINLSEGTDLNVVCNVTITDYSGLSDIDKVNATFHRSNTSVFADAENNTVYKNTNCSYNYSIDANNFAYYCDFNVTYYAYNGSWNCTVFVNSTLNYTQNGTNFSTIYPLYAVNVTDAVDFGNLSVFDTSDVSEINVTNWGNQPLNLTIYGYGGNSNASGGGLAFVCPIGTNISIGNVRWTSLGNISYDTMVAMTSGPRVVQNITVPKQMTDELSINTTYVKTYIPPNPFGVCNGTIVIEGQLGGNP
ncbi:MAG: hypothetical protein ABIJ21_03820 [Nanoarchaeota archaeon]